MEFTLAFGTKPEFSFSFKFFDFFCRKMRIYHFTQNIRFFFCYVNQVFHTHKMWIMWITLCITLIYGIF